MDFAFSALLNPQNLVQVFRLAPKLQRHFLTQGVIGRDAGVGLHEHGQHHVAIGGFVRDVLLSQAVVISDPAWLA